MTIKPDHPISMECVGGGPVDGEWFVTHPSIGEVLIPSARPFQMSDYLAGPDEIPLMRTHVYRARLCRDGRTRLVYAGTRG